MVEMSYTELFFTALVGSVIADLLLDAFFYKFGNHGKHGKRHNDLKR